MYLIDFIDNDALIFNKIINVLILESNYKIDKRERKSRDRQAKASYEDEPQSNKKTKTTLFQVDINMDSK